MNNQVKYYLENCSRHEYLTIMHKWTVLFNEPNHEDEEYKKALAKLTEYVEALMDKLGLIM